MDEAGADSCKVTSAFQSVNGRQRFTVELRPGETTIVSWKKLLKDAVKVTGPALAPDPPSNAHPALESRIAPGQPVLNEVKDAPPGSRLSAVIEKIERLYKGKHSSDEEDLNEIPDDDEYDTDDSFIDDTELDEYFEVDNSAIKHDGFFVNRGKLERIETSSLPIQQPKKRRRKDLVKDNGGSENGLVQNKNAKAGKKTSGKSALTVGNNLSSPSSQNITVPHVNQEEMKVSTQINASEISFSMKVTDTKQAKNPSPSRIPNGDTVVVAKGNDKQKPEDTLPKNHVNKLRDGSDLSDASNQLSNDRSSCAQPKLQPAKTPASVDDVCVQNKVKNSSHEQLDNNISESKVSMQALKVPHMHRKEVSSARPKSSMLEKAIRDLEKLVAESRPPTTDVQVTDGQAVKRRLRPEIKQKLAKVARIAQASQGKITKELINRLMSIVGHTMQLRTLKRNLNIMVNVGLMAKKEKDDRFQQIKREVVEMIKVQAPLMKSKALEQQPAVSDNLQEVSTEEKELRRRLAVDDALDDKICDLYDLFVEGLEEDAGPQVKKLYAELAQLWPTGFMDNHGIKRAICRAKDRKRALHSRRKEKIKRKALISRTQATRLDASSIPQPQPIQDKQFGDSSINGSTSHVKPANSTAIANTTARLPIPFTQSPNVERPKHEKGSTSNVGDARTDVLPKKKVKRKSESELAEVHPRSEKMNSVQGEEKHKSHKQVAAPVQSTTLHSAGPTTFQPA